MVEQRVHTFLTDITDNLTGWRRTLHQHPELGWYEYKTTYEIGKIVENLGFTIYVGKDALVSEERMGLPKEEDLLEYEKTLTDIPKEWMEKMTGGHTGLVAKWDSGKVGPHIALRFDIDALPIKETNEDSHLPYTEGFHSRNKGVMHSCGHDGHASIGLGVASFIHSFQDVLTGSFTLLFQPSEEGSRGAKAMVSKGWLDDVDYFLSGHIGIKPLEIGDVVATTTGFLSTSKINVEFTGVSAHAGVEPQKGKNALLAAAAAAVHLNGISRSSEGVTRINVGSIVAGNGRNVVADTGRMELETRGENNSINQYMLGEAKRIIKASAALYDVEADIEVVGEGVDFNVNEEWIGIVQEACQSGVQVKNVLPTMNLGGSEDVTYMMRRVEEKGGLATYLIFGTPLATGHHHPKFDFDEKVLPVAVESVSRLLLALGERSK